MRLPAAGSRCGVLVIEGAGGWRVPLTDHLSFADWVESHRWPVLLVVGLRLGCLNHAALRAESIALDAPLVSWIANRLPPLNSRVGGQCRDARKA